MSDCKVSIRRGSARAWDHAQLVHSQWRQAALAGMHLFIKRVATDDNIADLPSRMVRVCPLHFAWLLCMLDPGLRCLEKHGGSGSTTSTRACLHQAGSMGHAA